MLTEIIKQTKTALLLILLFSILTGIVYPIIVTGIAQFLFPWKANGSIFKEKGKLVGSKLIGQSFTDNKYFWGRPSATPSFPYNSQYSSGSNLGPSNPALYLAIKSRLDILHRADPENKNLIPRGLIAASGSGLDPDISPGAALYQIPRIAKNRHLPEKDIANILQANIKNRTLGILGEPRVNVLQLNLALDNLTHDKKPT